MPSIINGLFSGRSGISSHGNAIAVIGDNISNASTIGFKSSRAEFEDLIAGGQSSGKVVGSGSSTSAISTIFEQGTLEFSSRPLDLAIDGNGFFVVRNDEGTRYYTRAGNFKVDSQGFITTQGNLNVLGFPANGSGALENLNVNTISQDSVSTTRLTVAGNVTASADIIAPGAIPATTAAGSTVNAATTTTFGDLNDAAEFSTVVEIFDSLGASHTITYFYFHTGQGEYTVRGYVNSEETDDPASTVTEVGRPRQITGGAVTEFDMQFGGDGIRTNPPTATAPDMTAVIGWSNGAQDSTIEVFMDPFTQYANPSNIQSINQNGQGVGAVTSVSIEDDGSIFALLSNGQSAIIGTVGLINFSNPEGLTRIGNQLLQQSNSSGEPIVGAPLTGTLGAIQSGSVELSTVDIADQFVKLITVQRGFQANSRIITTINQLLTEIIQLV